MLSLRSMVFNLLVVVMTVALTVPAFAATAKDVNDLMRKAERLSFSGKAQEADALLKQAETAAEKILQSGDEAEITKVKRLESKLKHVRKQIDRKLGAASKRKAEPHKPPSSDAPAAADSSAAGELPSYVASKLDAIRRYLDTAQDNLDAGKVGYAEGSIARADENIALTEERYGKYDIKTHPDMLALKTRKAEIETAIAAAKTKQAEDAEKAAEAAAETQAEVTADSARFMEMYDKYQDKFSIMHEHGHVLGLEVKDAQAALAYYDFDMDEIFSELKRITEKYGVTGEAIRQKLRELGAEDPEGLEYKVPEVIEKMENLAKSRKASAAQIVKNVKLMMESNFSPEIKVKKLKESKEILRIGRQIDPNNPELNRLLAKMDDRIASQEQKNRKQIDQTVWKAHIADFAGPGDVKSLAKAALDFFRNSPSWGKNRDRELDVVAVSVQGQWQVAERNVLGQILSWRLPIHLAYTTPEYRKDDLAKVMELSAVTVKGSPGQAEKAPPFENYWVGNSWMMRLSKVK